VHSVACKIAVFIQIFLFIVPIGLSRASSPTLLPVGLLIQTFIYANTHTERVGIAATLYIRIHGVLDSKLG
jgi:hypothetical protein